MVLLQIWVQPRTQGGNLLRHLIRQVTLGLSQRRVHARARQHLINHHPPTLTSLVLVPHHLLVVLGGLDAQAVMVTEVMAVTEMIRGGTANRLPLIRNPPKPKNKRNAGSRPRPEPRFTWRNHLHEMP